MSSAKGVPSATGKNASATAAANERFGKSLVLPPKPEAAAAMAAMRAHSEQVRIANIRREYP